MRRVTVFDRSGGYAGELDPSRVFALTRKDTVNGEHSLTIVTSIGLEKGQRIMMQDDRGYWREFAVYGADVSHDSAGAPVGTYYCVWTLQADLMGTRVDAMPGTQTPVTAATALDAVLENTSRWSRGTVTNTNTGGASMYDTDGWSALSILIGTWGGEVDATIQADGFGVTARRVDLYSQQGDQEAKRRFDFGEDLQSVRRIIADGPLYCRVTPRGAGEQTDAGGYGRKITIESVNDGKDYLEDAEMTDLAKLPDGNGGWEYPTVEIENSECKEPAELKAWAQSVMQEHTRPKVTYEVDVIQLAREGIDMQGVSLGDAVQVVDRKFGGLRMTARVLEISVDELSGKSVALTLGSVREGLPSLFGSIGAQLATVSDAVQVMNGGTFSTDGYLSNLLGRLNVQINGTGGYTYITEGAGIRCYDAAVSDPTVGAEASAVVEVKGGTIRIANTKTAQGAWEWKTVFTSGHIAADLVTAAKITAGYIGSVSSGNYWDLDSGYLTVGNGQIIANVITSGKVQSANGKVYFDLDNNELRCDEMVSTASGVNTVTSIGRIWVGGSSYEYGLHVMLSTFTDGEIGFIPASSTEPSKRAQIKCSEGLTIWQGRPYRATGTWYDGSNIIMDVDSSSEGYVSIATGSSNQQTKGSISLTTKAIYLQGKTVSIPNGSMTVTGTFTVNGTKSRKVTTDSYNDRLLYCYETPSPMFGDIGSGTIGDDGYCYVEIDDVFSETARADLAYQVFLQKCGDGDLWVSDKAMTHFVVRGTPGLAFDWEIKCRQKDYEYLRLEDDGMEEGVREELDYGNDIESAYEDFGEEQERILHEAA